MWHLTGLEMPMPGEQPALNGIEQHWTALELRKCERLFFFFPFGILGLSFGTGELCKMVTVGVRKLGKDASCAVNMVVLDKILADMPCQAVY